MAGMTEYIKESKIRPGGCPEPCRNHHDQPCFYDAGHGLEIHRCFIELTSFFGALNALTTLNGNVI